MNKSTITRERLEQFADNNTICKVSWDERIELAQIALAAMDSESECLPLDYLQGHKDGLEWAAQLAEANHPETGDWLYDDPIELAKAIRKGPDMPPAQPVADSEPVVVVGDDGGDALSYRRLIQSFEPGTKLYRHAQPASERDQVRSAHAEWSQATFGNVGPVGPLKHLSKEALEAAAEPGDLSEWADMQFLLWDAQRRAGITDEQITQAMIDKLAVNKQRSWPEPKDGEPRLHINEQPAPVVPNGLRLALSNAGIAAPESDEMLAATCEKHIQALVTWVKDRKPFQSAPVVPSFEEWLSAANRKPLGWVKDAMREAYDACRAAMLQELKKSAGTEAICRSDENVQVLHTKSPAQSDCCPAQNSVTPAQNQGWIPVSERMPDDEQEVLTINKMGHRFVSFYDKHSGLFFDRLDAPAACCIEHVLVTHWMPLPAGPQEVKGE